MYQRIRKFSPLLLSYKPSRNIFSYFKQNTENTDKTHVIWDSVKNEKDLTNSSHNSNLTLAERRIIRKSQFLEKIELYLQKNEIQRRGYLEFAQGAISNMENYQVKSIIQLDLGYSKIQQDVVIELFRKMYKHKVMPDDSFGQNVIEIFGYRSHAMNYYRKHMYWVPKTRYTDPNPTTSFLPTNYDTDPGYITRLAANRICPDKTTQFHVIYSEKSDIEPWSMVSAQSDNQRRLLAGLCSSWLTERYQNNHDKSEEFIDRFKIYLDGPHFFFYSHLQFSYYVLWTESSENRLQREFTRLISQETRSQKIDQAFSYPLLGVNNDFDSTIIDDYLYLIDKRTKQKIPMLALDISTEGPNKALSRDIRPDFISRLSGVREGDKAISAPLRRLTEFNAIDPVNLELKKRLILENNLDETECRNSLRQIEPVFGMIYPEPEFSTKWSIMRRTHNLQKLPSSIYEKHEQVEGTILAVGVVGPSRNILDRQDLVTNYESSNERATHVKDPRNKNSQGRPINLTCLFEEDLSENRIQLAPESMLYQWLRHLEKNNPAMKYSSLILRAKKVSS